MITLESLNRIEAMRYLGCGSTPPDDNTKALLDECELKVLSACQPKYLYKYFDIDTITSSVTLKGCSLVLGGRDIVAHLEGCYGVVIMCATLSGGIDNLIRTLQITDMARAVVANALASVAVEQVCDRVEKLIDMQYNNCYKTFRFSPGYGDLPIDIQKDFLTVLDAPKKIGLCTGATRMLTPIKSVTAIIGLSNNTIGKKKRGCVSCNLKGSCQFRKAGNRCV
ncbi:MAG TPA: methionine synthase [Clostridiales bacterium]|nr:methionine synthase [Clostridiales bacterium]